MKIANKVLAWLLSSILTIITFGRYKRMIRDGKKEEKKVEKVEVKETPAQALLVSNNKVEELKATIETMKEEDFIEDSTYEAKLAKVTDGGLQARLAYVISKNRSYDALSDWELAGKLLNEVK